MENLNCKLKPVKWPMRLNKMLAFTKKNGDMKGTCPICKSTIFTKQHSNETLIRIVKKI